MNMNKKMRDAALTAMITLALSSSAMAMPTGGSVVQGNVSVNGTVASTIDSVASGATITANAHSIIDWQAFGIEAGQKLSFDTANGALLNRVIGSDMSAILGTLTQTGNNPLLLVNPNGILVGGNAVIDASQLVLSTLALSNQDFLNLANEGVANFTTEKPGASITVEKGAAINIDDVLMMAGGSVNVADGVTFSTTSSSDSMIEIAGANKLTIDRKNTNSVQDCITGIDSTKDNAVSFHGTFDNAKGTGNTNFHVDGGTVNLDNANIKLNNNSEAYLVAGNRTNNTTTTDNIISGKNLTVEGGKEVVIAGGKTTLENSKVVTDEKISVLAGSKFGREIENGKEQNIRTEVASASNEIVLKDSTLQNNNKEIQITGGKVTLDNTTVESKDTIGVKAYKSSEAMDNKSLNGAFDNGQEVTIKNGSKVQAKDTVVVVGYEVEKSATSTVQAEKDLTIVNHNYQGSNITPTVVADTQTTGYAVAPEAGKLSYTPPQDKPSQDTPSQDTPSQDKPSQDTPSQDKPSQDTPSQDKPSQDTPSQDKPSQDKPSQDTPSQDKPSQDTPSQDKPSQDKPSQDTPSNVKPSTPVSISEDDKKNMEEGKKVVDVVLASGGSLADKQAAIDKYVNALNNTPGDDRAKAAQVVGMLAGLKTDSNTAEGSILMLTVLNSYEPTNNSKEAADEGKIAEGTAVANQTADTQAVQAATGANESANDVAVNTSEVTA
ncbi:filamentous hemagglutinin N-terminal domain-containing protein [Anaerovibrio lipolyticus]|uniref:filamentous hemagglutinin N-terminal domain-containing protein n=1 Tax=Anaerovibrio lipolyticus TaxID=82374 RepID=UPI0025D7A4AF|nr:filamentous hemagglutinin N-terminal domain-containing protein [Anaerovibrio lipolyticus]